MVAKHLGSAQSGNPKRYLKFAEDIEKLKQFSGLTCECGQLDAYLWIAGEYWSWKENSRIKINADLKRQFERLTENPDTEPLLAPLLGIGISGATA